MSTTDRQPERRSQAVHFSLLAVYALGSSAAVLSLGGPEGYPIALIGFMLGVFGSLLAYWLVRGHKRGTGSA